jgi:hypothetical protein
VRLGGLRSFLRRRLSLLGRLAVGMVLVGLVLSAMLDDPWLFVVFALLAGVYEQFVEPRTYFLRTWLRDRQLGLSARGVVYLMALDLLVVRHFAGRGDVTVVGLVALTLTLPLCRSLYLVLVERARAGGTSALPTRNVDLGGSDRLRPVPPVLTESAERRLVTYTVPVAVLAAVAGALDSAPLLVAGVLAYDVMVLAAAAALWTRLSAVEGNEADQVAAVVERLRALRPEVILYFSGSFDSTYQLNTWLPTASAMSRRVLVVVRERYLLDTLDPTDLPVACIPSSVTIMNLAVPEARVVLYPANRPRNVHMLREPAMTHVFVGHGDSDKVSSVNPFAKAYDQVWVAGRAGRDRYARADVGVRDDAIVEVGRPQLDGLAPAERPVDRPFTVLYAPTWEGWSDEQFSSSITEMGPALVQALLSATPAVRVIYKPHPFTGQRDPRAAASHARILRMMAKAGAQSEPPASLTRLQRRIEEPSLSAEQRGALAAEWSESFWAAVTPRRHAVVTGQRPGLYDCFDHADVLLADVSSVVSDYLASGKPYVVANPKAVPAAVFREEFPSVGAAHLLSPDCSELDDVLADVRGPDSLAGARAQLREYLLGPPDQPAMVRWEAAVERAYAAAVRRRPLGAVPLMEGVDEDPAGGAGEADAILG